ncbi:MAG TPA: NADH-quinone oxidoreductase subunit C [Firmicutes bacterium]|nr:NADH-quinone oxidoreductase subunit C [Bacillota bacterium]
MAGALERLRERFPELEPPVPGSHGELRWRVPAERYLEVCEFLGATDGGFTLFSSLTAVDRGDRFELVLVVVAPADGERLVLTTELGGREPTIPSVTPVWAGADWPEREVYDLFGVVFTGHPNLTRLLLDADFAGHPLRKDYGVVGGRASVGQ